MGLGRLRLELSNRFQFFGSDLSNYTIQKITMVWSKSRWAHLSVLIYEISLIQKNFRSSTKNRSILEADNLTTLLQKLRVIKDPFGLKIEFS